MNRNDIRQLVTDYAMRFPDENDVVARFFGLIDEHERCFERDCWAGHITGSAWLLDRKRERVLLTHHKKLDRWLQLGGHSDGDPDAMRVAMREAEEESGLAVRILDERVFDLDVHEIPARKSDPAHYHFDVRFAFTVDGGEMFRVSEESHALAWVQVARLAEFTDEASMLRMAAKHQSLLG